MIFQDEISIVTNEELNKHVVKSVSSVRCSFVSSIEGIVLMSGCPLLL